MIAGDKGQDRSIFQRVRKERLGDDELGAVISGGDGHAQADGQIGSLFDVEGQYARVGRDCQTSTNIEDFARIALVMLYWIRISIYHSSAGNICSLSCNFDGDELLTLMTSGRRSWSRITAK